QDHPVFLGALVNRPIALVIVILQRTAHLTQTAKSGAVEAVHQRYGLGIVEPDRAETGEALGMLLDEGMYVRQVLRRSQDERGSVVLIEAGEHLLEKFLVAVVMDMRVYQSALCGLAEKVGAAHRKQHQREQRVWDFHISHYG